jgi:AraC-like DNA-binding protein
VAGTVSVLLLRPVVAALRDAPAFWRATDLTPELVADTDARLTPAQFALAWAELVRQTHSAVALDIARHTPPGAFGIVEYVCRSAPTVGEALRRWGRYLNLLEDAIEVALVLEDDRACLRVIRECEVPANGARELCFALVARQARELAGPPFQLLAVDFTHRTIDPVPYRAHFDAPVHFGAPHTQLVIPRAALDAPLASSDPNLLEILTRAADDLHRQRPADATMVSQVARVLREALRTDEAHVDRIAKRLGLTSRSLQRRLKDEGTSFNAVREDVRRQLSRRYLDEGLSIAEISFLLGFSEPSAFFRAFKRWNGMTPLEARSR